MYNILLYGPASCIQCDRSEPDGLGFVLPGTVFSAHLLTQKVKSTRILSRCFVAYCYTSRLGSITQLIVAHYLTVMDDPHRVERRGLRECNQFIIRMRHSPVLTIS